MNNAHSFFWFIHVCNVCMQWNIKIKINKNTNHTRYLHGLTTPRVPTLWLYLSREPLDLFLLLTLSQGRETLTNYEYKTNNKKK